MRRSGYTLLEVLLAMAIALLLMAALYVSVDVQLRSAQAGRDRVEQSTLVRALFGRMDADAACVIGQADPARFRNPQALSSGNTGASGSGSTGTGSTGSGSTSSATTGSTSGGTSSSTNSPSTLSTSGTVSTYTNANSVQVIILPYGVKGDAQTLHMFVSRVPRVLVNQQLQQNEATSPPVGDLRRVSYWLVDSGDSGGLAKQEVKLATSDDSGAIDSSTLPPSVDNPTQYVLAEEVKSLQFEYFDGMNWNDEWDSTTPGADGVTPIGSPPAIRITIGVAQTNSNDGEVKIKSYQHVIVIPTYNGTTPLVLPNSTGGGATSP